MKFDNFNVEEVFSNYAQIMQENGSLQKNASYTVPHTLLDQTGNFAEIDTKEAFNKMAKEGGVDKLYGLFSDDLYHTGHPEKSPKMVDASDGLGVVENLDDKHKGVMQVAESKVKLASRVLDLATELDQAGFTAIAVSLDRAAERLLQKSE